MHKPSKPYVAYLLRLWRAREVRDTWRISLEEAQTHELHGFANLEEVFAFLQQAVEGEGAEEEASSPRAADGDET